MSNDWNTQYISADNINRISRGKRKIAIKYLKQFQDLVPSRLTLLRQGLQKEDRTTVRKVLHSMSPQLQFFGIPGVVPPIKRIAADFQTMPWDEIEEMVEEIMSTLEEAKDEVDMVLRTQF